CASTMASAVTALDLYSISMRRFDSCGLWVFGCGFSVVGFRYFTEINSQVLYQHSTPQPKTKNPQPTTNNQQPTTVSTAFSVGSNI
ncbi:MAG: hypothetical protein SPD44_11905, partial [Prevotella sp.]|nr:hypothetical protein [Prevotella sp.]